MTTLFNSGATKVAETADLGADAASVYAGNQAAVSAPIAPPLTGKRVNVVAPDGRAFSVDESELPSVTARGYKQETWEARAIREYVEENKGASGALIAAVQSFANEATFGVTDAAMSKTVDPLAVKMSEALRREHSAANILGGVGGFAASMVYGGPLFDAARAAKVGTETAILGGKAIARGAEHALAEKAAASLVTEKLIRAGVPAAEAVAAGPGIARKIAASAAGTAVEGGILTAPKAVTEAMLGDPERAGETLLYGLGGGALVGAAGPAAKAIAKATASGIGRVKLPGSYRELAGGFAEEQAWKATNARKLFGEMAERVGGERAVGRTLLEEGLVKDVREALPEYAKRIGTAKGVVGEGIGAINAEADQLGARIGLDELRSKLYSKVEAVEAKAAQKSVASKLRAEVDDLLVKLGDEPAGAVRSAADHGIGKAADREAEAAMRLMDGDGLFSAAARKADVSVTELHGRMRELSEVVYEHASSKSLLTEHLQDVRGILAKLRREAVAGADPALAERLATADEKFSRLALAEKAVLDSAKRSTANAGMSLTDNIQGAAGLIAGLASGHPLGALAAPAMAIANKLRREEGNALAAKALDRYAKGAGMAGILEANHAVATQLERVPAMLAAASTGSRSAVATALPTRSLGAIAGALADRKPRGEDSYSHFAELAERLTDLSSNPTKMQAELARLMEPYEGDAPGVTAALAQKATAAVGHLLETMPRTATSIATPLTPARPNRPPAAAVAEWGRRWQVVQDPFVVLDRIADRSLARADIETLGAVYPKLRQEIVRRVQMWAADGEAKTLPGYVRQSLSLALGVALDPTNVASFQKLHAQRAEQQAQGPKGGGGGKAPKLPGMQTDVGRLSNK